MAQDKTQSIPKINVDTVKHIANLVRLGISDQEASNFGYQFTEIIDYFRLLNEVDTENILPANEIIRNRNVVREDQVITSMSRDDFLNNVPRKKDAFVEVPAVFDE